MTGEQGGRDIREGGGEGRVCGGEERGVGVDVCGGLGVEV